MKIRKQHPYNGSTQAGKPTGPVLKVIRRETHEPVDGPTYATILHLEDGTWVFEHNAHII